MEIQSLLKAITQSASGEASQIPKLQESPESSMSKAKSTCRNSGEQADRHPETLREDLCTGGISANCLRSLRQVEPFHPMGKPLRKTSRCCRTDSIVTRRTTGSFAPCRRRKGSSTR